MKLLKFSIDGNLFAIDNSLLEEVITMPENIFQLPNTSKNILGAINYNINISPVFSIDRKLGIEFKERGVLIICRASNIMISFPIDNISEVFDPDTDAKEIKNPEVKSRGFIDRHEAVVQSLEMNDSKDRVDVIDVPKLIKEALNE